MSKEINIDNQQSDWLSQVDRVNDTEAAQVNGGSLATSPLDAGSSSSDLIGTVSSSLEDSLATNLQIQQLYLAYSTATEAFRIISEAVQKGIDISENERQDISQAQE